MSFATQDGFHWRESPHQADLFHINPHRKAYTYFYEDLPIARIEPSGRGLIARFSSSLLDTPGRPVAVSSVPRGKIFVENWIRPRQTAVIAACRQAQIADQIGMASMLSGPSRPENSASL